MANANIFQQYLQPVRTVADFEDQYAQRDLRAQQLQAAQQQNALQALTMRQQTQQMGEAEQDRNALQRIAAGWGADTTPDQRIAALRGSGRAALMQQADALEKGWLDRRRVEADVGKIDSETLGHQLTALKTLSQGVLANPTREAAIAALDQWKALTGKDSPQDRQAIMAMQTPDDVRRWAAGKALSAEQLLPRLKQVNNGKVTSFVDENTLTNPGGPKPIQMTTTPGEDLSANTSRANNAAQVGATIRGQNLTDARAREQLAQGKWQYDGERGGVVNATTGEFRPALQGGQPIGPKDKPLTDGQAKAALFGARMEASNKILEDLAGKGTQTSVPGSRAPVVGGAITAMSGASQQQLDQAKRDFINATLRRESGAVISDSEFANAEKQYFPQIGDSSQVIAQKARNRAIAVRGVQAEVPNAPQVVGKIIGGSSAAGAARVVNFGDLK